MTRKIKETIHTVASNYQKTIVVDQDLIDVFNYVADLEKEVENLESIRSGLEIDIDDLVVARNGLLLLR